ncbi:unnamed protein product [Penicillium nalgiovense]|nr:unnamed protein product [Penicillium nalgiovense]
MRLPLNTPSDDEKTNGVHLEVGPIISHEEETFQSISEEHKNYLISKHGTWKLQPLPSMNDDDPLNWSQIHKNLQLGMISFHAFMCTFLASGIIPLYEILAEELNQSITSISYLTSVQILFYALAPLVLLPVMNRYGRHKTLLILTLGASAFNVGCVFSKSYSSLMIFRIFSAIFLSPGVAVGGSAVGEMMFKHELASKTGWWSLMVAMGVPAGPFITGFIQQRYASKYVFVLFAAINFGEFVAYLLLGRETLFNYKDLTRNHTNKFKSLFQFSAIIPAYKVTFKGIIFPLTYFYSNWRIFLSTSLYSIIFCYTNIVTTVELPTVFGEKFHLDPQAMGLQFLAIIIGYIIGIQMAGWLSDWWMKRAHYREYRLWLSYPGFITTFVGLLVFGFQVVNAENNHWNITPLIGLAILSFGCQLVSTTLITYCIDIIPHQATEIVLFIGFVRQVFGFIGPFYFPPMFKALGFDGAFGLLGGISFICMLPIVLIHILGVRSFRYSIS